MEVRSTTNDAELYKARYDISTAAHHLGMPRSTVAAWAQGMGRFRPVLTTPQPGYLSFVNLTEAFVLYAMRRRYAIKMPKIREAIRYVEKEMGEEHPLAFQQLATDYVDIFIKTAGGAINVSRGGQARLEEVHGDLARIEWRKERPIALFPVLRHRDADDFRPIRISPLVAFGRPVLTGTRIPTRVVFERFYGGESVAALADDYDVTQESIEEAVRAETGIAA